MKLPAEIRHNIIRLLLGSFYRYCEATKKSFIPLTLSQTRERLSLVEKPHPARKVDYELVSYPCVLSSRPMHDAENPGGLFFNANPAQDNFMAEVIRNLSNVSPEFKRDLCEVFWKRAHLNLGGDHHSPSHEIMRTFLSERPAAHRGIKSLSLCYDLEKGIKGFNELCTLAASSLNLEELYITLIIDSAVIDRWTTATPEFSEWMNADSEFATRRIKVANQFKLDLKLYWQYKTTHDDWKWEHYSLEDQEIAAKIQHKYTRVIKQLLNPNSLRVPLSTSEAYLLARPATGPPTKEPSKFLWNKDLRFLEENPPEWPYW